MKIIYNKLIPFKGFYAINLFGILFVRGNRIPNDITINHESIHTKQMKEMFYIFFYIWYFIEWIINLFKYGIKDSIAYYNIRFEKEAFNNEQNLDYLKTRKHYNWLKLK